MSRIIIIEELLLVNENANELILKQKMAQFLNFSISVDIKSRYFLLYVINDVVSQNTTNVILFCGNTHQPLSITTTAPAIMGTSCVILSLLTPRFLVLLLLTQLC